MPEKVSAATGLVAPLIYDKFDSYTDGPFTITTTGTTSSGGWKGVSGALATVEMKNRTDGKGKYAQISSTDGKNYYFGQSFTAQKTPVVTEFDLNIPVPGSTPDVFICSGTAMNGSSSSLKVLRMQASGSNIVLYTDSTNTSSMTTIVPNYSKDKWYNFKVEFYQADRKFYITVKDEEGTVCSINPADGKLSSRIPYDFYDKSGDAVGSIAFQPLKGDSKSTATGNFTLNVDNVKIYSPVELSGLTVAKNAESSSLITFDKNTTDYPATVENKVSSLLFTPTVENPDDLAITINDDVVQSGVSNPVQLSVGENNIKVTVTKNGYVELNKTYNFKITRLEVAPDVKSDSVRPGDSNLTITWDETNLIGLSKVNIYDANNLTTPIQTVNAGICKANITGLTNGTEYSYILKGVNASGEESAGISVKGTPALVPVTAIKMDKVQLNLLPKESAIIAANVLPTDANKKEVTYASMDNSIATVDETGKVTAVKLGETYIIATSVDGGKMAATRVVVSDSDSTEVKNATVTQSNGSLTLNWEDSLDSTVSGVNIYSYDPTYEYDALYATAKLVTNENRGVKTHTFNGLTNGTIYNYIIKGVRADGSETLGVRVCGIPNSDTLLEGLKLIGVRANGSTKDIEMLQNFDSGEVSYTAIVTNDIVKVKGIPYVKNPENVRIIVNGELVQNGQESGVLTVKEGALTNFGVNVITKDNAISRTYIPVIYRQTTSQTFLKDLKVSGADAINNNFKQRTLAYLNNYDFTTDKVVIMPTAIEGTDAVIKINVNNAKNDTIVENGVPIVVNLAEGTNNVNIVVTSKVFTGAITTYNLILNRYTKNDLEDLQVTPGVAVKPFSSGNTKYYVDVQNNVDEISVLPKAFDTNAVVKVNDIIVANGQASGKIKLNEGSNVINVKVNDNSIGTKTYTIYAYRLPQTDYLYMRDEGTTVTVRTQYTNLVFDKTNSNLITMSKPGDSDVLGNGYGYFLANPSYKSIASGKDVAVTAGFNSTNTAYRVYSQDENKIDLAFSMTDKSTGPLRYAVHYVITKNEPGFYNYMTCNYDASVVLPDSKEWNVGQVRWSIRADENKFDRAHYERGIFKLISPHNVDGTSVSDTTWLLPDGTIHGKYDLVEYEDHKIYGMTGDDYGIWFIKAQDDYTDGMPTAQELAVHETNSTPIINWAPEATHYGRTLETAPTDWKYMWGPMFVYLNNNKDTEARWQDANAVKDKQVAEWPYNFIENPLYEATNRGTVKGKINLTEGVGPEGTTVILSNPNVNWEYQSSKYTYSAKADKDGNFVMDNVRAGTYRIYAFQTGVYTNYTAPKAVEIKANTTNDIGTFVWDTSAFGTKLWEIGKADRTPKEFKNGNIRIFGDYRTYPFDFPNGVDFTIGKSNEKTDWNYGQVPSKTFGVKDLLLTESDDQPWVWKIRFNVDTLPTVKDGKLTIAIAASRAPSLRVLLNDSEIANYAYGNKIITPDDSAYVRSATQGIYKLLEIPFDTSLLKVGENIIKLDPNRTMYSTGTVDKPLNPNLSDAARITDVGAAIIYDAIKMETAKPVASVKPVSNVEVIRGSQAVLPKTVTAVYEDSTQKEVAVIWGAVNTSVLGSYTIEGKVVGFNGKATVNVIVREPEVDEPIITPPVVIPPTDSANKLPIQDVVVDNGKAVIAVDSTLISKDKVNEIKPTLTEGTKAVEVKVDVDNIKDGAGALAVVTEKLKLDIPFKVIDFSKVEAGATVKIQQSSSSTDESLKEVKGIGEVYDFGLALYSKTGTKLEDVHDFNGDTKVQITVNLTDAQLKNLNTSKLGALYYNEDSKKWEFIGGSFDATTKKFSFETPHFSKYTIADMSSVPVFDEAQAQSVDQGNFIQFKVNAKSSNNVSLTYTATNLPAGASFDAVNQNLNWTPAIDQAGSYTISFNVTDGVNTVKQDVTVVVRDVPVAELVEKALAEKDFYHFNIAYYKVEKLKDETEKAVNLDKLGTIHDLVWNDDIANINKILDSLAVTGSGKTYDEIQAIINGTKLSAVDKGYLLGEVTSWGKKLVFTDAYKAAVDVLGIAWNKLDADSVSKADSAIAKVTNTYSKEYLLGELAEVKAKVK
jgi:rhamnogalacturonan endolyase